MIDDRKEATALIRKMEAQLPIPVKASRALVSMLKSKGLTIGRDMQVKRLFYGGDEAGIACDVTPEGSKSAIVCSITYLTFNPDHPLAAEIRAYQEKRTKRLVEQEAKAVEARLLRQRK